ncbi:MAG TPA: hypothetical protein VHX16_11800 [Chloroflexota bacterium]|nr:hypothetical protein [Chloroflexota bacterium]
MMRWPPIPDGSADNGHWLVGGPLALDELQRITMVAGPSSD